MTSPGSLPRLAVIGVTRSRPNAPDYHARLEDLDSRLTRLAARSGWQATRFSAEDLGERDLLSLTDDADAVVLMGGEDVAPAFYCGASGYEREGAHYERADAAQIALVRRALERRTPLLGVCRGHQILNVALGGDLEQHLADTSLHLNPRVDNDKPMLTHAVALDPSSRLAAVLGSSIGVQSSHHQAIARVAPDLVVVGRASDGVVEAVEHAAAPIAGVQWHPKTVGRLRGSC